MKNKKTKIIKKAHYQRIYQLNLYRILKKTQKWTFNQFYSFKVQLIKNKNILFNFNKIKLIES